MKTVERFLRFRLDSTAKVVGWLEGVSSAILIIVFSVLLADIPKYIERLREKGIHFKNQADAENLLTIFIGVILFLLCLNVIIDFCLVWGTVKGRHKLLLPWLILYGIYFLIHLITTFVSCGSITLSAFILHIAVLALQFQLWNAMRSLYLQIKDAQRQFPMDAGYVI